ncbi:MAG: phosphoglycerate dehydrogenase [Deltaproteobacteria bacterium]|nr:phosphoglycerate dehydrogenase [Deltaproteobacteria bacterium]MCL5277402.1 phosphoglycerate dehydrogenase [Deltaproteobacteria bacterium]
MPKVLIADGIADEGLKILTTSNIQVDVRKKTSAEELASLVPDYEGLVVRSASKVTKDVIAKASKLKIVGRAGIGVDNVDVSAATKKGIVVMNTPGGNSVTTAEHTLAMIMSMARRIPQATASLKSGKWEKSKFEGVELYNKTLGIIGFGNIGGILADRALGLKMRVIVYDPFISEEKAMNLGVKKVSLDEIYTSADIITVHTPKTRETAGMLNKAAFDKMKKGVMVVNCARGGIINEAALLEALQSGKVACAALDVFEVEPPVENPLLKLDNVIVTPHLGASTHEAQVNVSVDIAKQFVDYFTRGAIKNAVNYPSISVEMYPFLEPYIRLVEKLGKFMGQIHRGDHVEEITIEYGGEITELNTQPVTLAGLKGFLQHMYGEDVNYINASVIAKENGINIIETKTGQPVDFTNLITIKLKSGDTIRKISGAVFGRKHIRLTMIDNFYIEAIPEGNILVLRNIDKPGVIGRLGTYLGKHGINIARMELGRESVGSEAIALLNIDDEPSDEVMQGLRGLENIISAEKVAL